MNRYFIPLIFGAFIVLATSTHITDREPLADEYQPIILTQNNTPTDLCAELYQSLGLEGKVSMETFQAAYTGYQEIEGRKRDILTLIDFTKPSNTERLYVIDMKAEKVLYESVVAHGKGSGELYATRFSNTPESHQSSLGFYLTAETYQGGNGYSLRLNGLERGINDNARARAIVIHGAKYANPSVCKNGNRLGRSYGCPALPETLNKPIIDTIKGGSLLFIYGKDPQYLAKSSILADLHPTA